MNYEISGKLPKGSALVEGVTVTDNRGSLTFVEGVTLPFSIKRMFWITSVPKGAVRGGHAHASCSEAVFAVSGSFRMHLSNGKDECSVMLHGPGQGILVPAGMWCDLTDFSDDCVCVVAASEPYDGKGYINTYENYLKYQKKLTENRA